jgi:GPI mannosyltransferase 3
VWGAAIGLVTLLVALGARQAPLFLVAAATVIAVHSAIAHKEYRYFYAGSVMLMVLAGIGLGHATAQAGEWLRRLGLRAGAAGAIAAAAALLCSVAVSTQAWTSPTMTALRYRWHDQMLAARFASRLPAMCGLGLYGYRGTDWLGYGGYAWLHHRVPMYWPMDDAAVADAAPGFDALIYANQAATPLGFTTLHCFGGICVAQRQGHCEARPMAPMPFPEGLEGAAPSPDRFPAIEPSVRPAEQVRQ